MRNARLVLLGIATAVLGLLAPTPPPAAADSLTTVHITGEGSGFLPAPCTCQASVILAVHGRGDDVSLTGSGTAHASTGATNLFELTGSISDSIVSLSGTVYQSSFPILEGSSVEIEADTTTGVVTFTLTPDGGPFNGIPLIFVGSATIVVTGN
jgi:hypothetical protein